MFENEIEELRSDNKGYKEQNTKLISKLEETEVKNDEMVIQDKKNVAIMQKMQFDIDELTQQLEVSNTARATLRDSIQESNEKLIEMEEQVYKYKSKSHELIQ